MTMQTEDERLGQVAYEAYATNTGGKSLVNGDELPLWDDLGDEFKTAWIASAREVVANAIVKTLTAPPPAEPEDEGDEVGEASA
jgi:hypothetical protein